MTRGTCVYCRLDVIGQYCRFDKYNARGDYAILCTTCAEMFLCLTCFRLLHEHTMEATGDREGGQIRRCPPHYIDKFFLPE